MQSIQRFVNSFCRTFFLPVGAAIPCNSHPLLPHNPCRDCVCSALRVARGRILEDRAALGKHFLKKIQASSIGAMRHRSRDHGQGA